MTTEELLKPRYKVIADYPSSPYKVGEILFQFPYGNGNHYFALGNSSCPLDNGYAENYPHLFKRLEWWEERKPEDMPKFVQNAADKLVFEVVAYQIPLGSVRVYLSMKKNGWQDVGIHNLHDCLPATYETYKSSQP